MGMYIVVVKMAPAYNPRISTFAHEGPLTEMPLGRLLESPL